MMDDETQQARTLMLMVLLALWCGAWVYSVFYLLSVAPTGDGFTRGMNRITGFLGWQGVAGMVAFAAWGVGLSFPKGSGVRHASAVPFGMALALLLLVLGVVVWGLFVPV